LNFKDNQFKPSPDVDKFIPQLIANRVRLRDEKLGVEISIEGNEEAYSKAIFDKLIPSWWARTFPNLTFWLSFHKKLNSIHYIALLVIVLSIVTALIKSEVACFLATIGLIYWMYIALIKILSGNSKDQEFGEIGLFVKQLQFWKRSSNILQLNQNQITQKLSNNIKILLTLRESSFQKILNPQKTIQVILIGSLIYLSLLFSFILGLGEEDEISFLLTTTILILVYILVPIAIVTIIYPVSIFNKYTKLPEGIKVLLSLLMSFTSLVVLVLPIEYDKPILSLLILVSMMIFRSCLLFYRYKKALKAEQTRQAEAGQPGA